MSTLLSKYILRTIGTTQGRAQFQNWFEIMHNLSLRGLNYNCGGDVKTSGELFALDFVKQKLSGVSSPILFDVGANVGKYSLLIQEKFKKDYVLYAFEPSPQAFQQLINNIKADNHHVLQLGLNSEDGPRVLYSDHLRGSPLGSFYKRNLDHFGIAFESQQTVEVVKLDSFCREFEIPKIDFLKLDTEGSEFDVLLGGKELIDNGKIHFIQFEFGGTQIDSRIFFRDFFELLTPRYTIHRILKDGLQPITSYSEKLEIFLPSNFLCQINA